MKPAACMRASIAASTFRFDAGVGDGAQLQRVGHDDPPHMRLQKANHRGGVAGRLEHGLIVGAQAACKLGQLVARQLKPMLCGDHPVLENRNLGKAAVDVQTDRFACSSPLLFVGSRRDCTTTTDPRSQRNRAGRRGGQITTRARSSLS
jgi:hypothetical protein